MKKLWLGVPALAAVVLFVLSAASQPPEGKDKKDGPPRRGPGGPPPRFQMGQVLPPFARDELKLTRTQEQEIARLEKEVKERLSKILTAEQQKTLENLRPPRPPGPPPGGPGGGRPEKPGRPPDKPEPEEANQGQAPGAARAGIQWFATWEGGLKEARRTGRPILLVSAAPHCAGVSGTW
jgi:hypothetical protein